MRWAWFLRAWAICAWVLLCSASSSPAAADDRLDVPFFSQDELLCGGACAAMVVRYWGDLETGPEDFADLVQPRLGGITVDALVSRIREAGWRVQSSAGSESAADWLRRRIPWIALIESGPGRLHYVVVVGWSAEHVVFHDPAEGPDRVMDRQEFLHAWKAADHGAILVQPGPPRPPSDTPIVGSPDDPAQAGSDSSVARAVAEARRGNLDVAEHMLDRILADDPGRSAAWRELGGIRFRQERWNEAADAARRACAIDPSDTLARQVLAASHHLAGRTDQALDEWNRLGRPRIGFVDIEGVNRTRYRAVEDALGVARGELLTSAALRLARRRAASLPSVKRARVDYRVQSDGTVVLQVQVWEKARWPDPRVAAVGEGLRAITRRSVRVRLSNLTGWGDLWTTTLRGQEGRPLLQLQADIPGGIGPAWVTTLEWGWERESFGPTQDPEVVDRRRAGLGVQSWLNDRLHLDMSLAYHRPDEGQRRVGSRFALSWDSADPEVRIQSGLQFWVEEGSSFTGAFVQGRWAFGTNRPGFQLALRAGAESVDRRAPRWLWPGAGVGVARPYLLRAHPLLDDGVITGRAFAPSLAHGGMELQRWMPPLVGLMRPGLAFFVDAAVFDPPAGAVEALVDVGIGLRLALFEDLGELCLDAAHGVEDGRQALSLVLRSERVVPW